VVLIATICAGMSQAAAAGVLENEAVRAEFGAGGLVSITEKAGGRTVRFAGDGFAVFAGSESVESDFLTPTVGPQSPTNCSYRFESGPWTVRVEYELQPGWRFLSKRVLLANSGKKEVRVQRLEMLRGQIETPISNQQRIRDGTLLRFTDSGASHVTHSLFLVLQNPFLQLKRQDRRLSMAYAPDMPWKAGGEMFASDRLCLGVCEFRGPTYPATMIPEWKQVGAAEPRHDTRLHVDEVDALVDCVRTFLLWRPTRTTRINVGWCENDYQIDIATPEGRAEYKRIIDQAAAIGCRNVLFAPANSAVSSLEENRDAWGWENLLWLTMGQKLRKGEWDPAKDKLPASVQELVDYAKAKDIGFLAYVYPSLPFMQQQEWTRWVPNGKPGGYLGADTGLSSFQDWLLDKMVAFQKTTGASGFAFDHWWIAYDETTSSKYAQWAGCRRILEELRRRMPDIVIDGRQQYHHFGAWTWLAGTYPHPLNSDEQPESFRAFPDLHWSRVSADRQRRTAYWYRTQCFVPPEIMPGYMTHQTARLNEKGECPRGRFRSADWDLLGWRYSVLSSIATAPYNLVVNYIPARDEREFKAFSVADQTWFRDWLDWTDGNLEILSNVKPILGAPQLGGVDGTAAFKDGHGFVFLFNPNYRQFAVELPLDQTIGLTSGKHFTLRQLYPDAEKGRWLAPPDGAHWKHGDKVPLPLAGAEAFVIEVAPAPARVEQPLLLGAVGAAKLEGSRLELTGVRGEVGIERQVSVVLPEGQQVSTVTVNGNKAAFNQRGSVVVMKLRFAGVPCAARQQIGTYDPGFAGGAYKGEVVIPSRVFAQLEARKRAWPVDYSAEERAAVWLNSDRLLLFINVAEPDDEAMKGVTLRVDGEPVPVRPAYTSIVRSNPKNTFTGWYADVSALKPDVKHTFEVELPKLAPGQFQGLFLDTVEAEYTSEVIPTP
jgi:hypothetical protein